MNRFSIIILCFMIGGANADSGTYYTTSTLNSSGKSNAANFKPGWYENKRDVTYIKLVPQKKGIGLRVLYSERGLFCSIDNYLPYNLTKTPNNYTYVVGNGCKATIHMNPVNNTFTMTDNSDSKCWQEFTYNQFCDGDLDFHYINQEDSQYFINVNFTYAKDQNDEDYTWN